MALDKTPDMEGLTPAERAALYKQRAAAAGIGRATPAKEGSGAQPAPAPAPATPTPAPPARETAVVAPAGATAVAERPAGAGVPAKVAQAAAARREQVAAVARGDAAKPAPSAKEQADRLVYVWPHLVAIEFLSAMLVLLSLVVVSLVLQAPLEGHANPDRTPNPSKAPWYFLNLQELLLHMHPALAGVLIPSGVLFGLLPLMPYFDRNTADVGKWFGTPKAKPICTFTAIYTTVVLIALILFDEFVGVKPMMTVIADATGQPWLVDPEPLGIGALGVPTVIVPMILMNVPIVVLLILVRVIYKPDGIRDYMFALFTGFVVSFAVLTIVGTFFRGQGMHLYWPWDPRQARIE